MKKRLPAFLAGMLTTALVCGLTVSALAANGLLTINVDPSVTIKVNGEVFQPKNEQGEDVMVFKYGGTTYAPVRALAEAYGLKVNFDQFTNMATVDAVEEPTTPPDTTAIPGDYSDWTPEEEAAYQVFKGMWEINFQGKDYGQNPDSLTDQVMIAVYYCTYTGNLSTDSLTNSLVNNPEAKTYYQRMCEENVIDDCPVTVICYGSEAAASAFDLFGRAILTKDQFYIIGWDT